MSDLLKAIKELSQLSHGHKQLPTLKKFSVNAEGKLLFDEVEIKGEEIKKETFENIFSNSLTKNTINDDFVILFDNENNTLIKTKNSIFKKKINKNAEDCNSKRIAIFFGSSAEPRNKAITFDFVSSINAHLFGDLSCIRSYNANGSSSFANQIKCFSIFSKKDETDTYIIFEDKFIFETEANATNFQCLNGIEGITFSNDIYGIHLNYIANFKQFFVTENILSDFIFTFSVNELYGSSYFETKNKGYIVGGSQNSVSNDGWAFATYVKKINEILYTTNTSSQNFSSLQVSRVHASCGADNTKALVQNGFGGLDVKIPDEKIILSTKVTSIIDVNVDKKNVVGFPAVCSSKHEVASIGGLYGTIQNNNVVFYNLTTMVSYKNFSNLYASMNDSHGNSNSHGGLTV